MEISGTTILFVLLGGMAGLTIGVICGYFLGARKKTNAQHKEDLKRKKLHGIAVLWRERANGRLIIEAESLFKTKLEGFSAGKAEEIQQALNELAHKIPEPAASGGGSAADQPASIGKPNTQGSLVNAPVNTGVDNPISPELAQLAAIAIEEKPNSNESIVMQIDKVLQKLLADSEMKNRAIRLGEDPVMGVIVWVGVERFNGIDAVTDLDVKALIHNAVTEWESSIKSKK